MNDKIIISAISKIYFVIISFLLFIFFALSTLFIILQNGLDIESISVPNIKIKQLYIKWNENLDVSIKEVKITRNKNDSNNKLNLEHISKYLKRAPHFYNIFERISIDKITLDDTSATFRYIKGEDGYLSINSPDILIKSSLSFESKLLNIKIDQLNDKNRNIKLHGNLILNIEQKNATASLKVNIDDEINMQLYAFSNTEKLHYKLNTLEEIKSIDYTMGLLNLDKELKYWAHDAIGFSTLNINSVYGWLDYADLKNAYKNIYASATGNNLTYAYHNKLDKIHTKKTDLIFENGVLFIYPKQAHTYKSQLGKSWLKIDFTQKEELLTLKLLFDGKLDRDTLRILKQYKIRIPFLQNSGKTKVDLTLKVNLRTITVDAKGDFYTKKANFNYNGYDIDFFDAHINLDNYQVKIDKTLAKYKKNITIYMDVQYDVFKSAGIINFDIHEINFPSKNLFLDSSKNSLKAKYIMSKQGDLIKIDNSSWSYYNNPVIVAKVSLPFNLEKQKLNIPNTSITSKSLAKANLSGKIDLKNQKLDLDIYLKSIYYSNIKLSHANIPIKLTYDKSFILSSKKRIDFTFNDKSSFLNPLSIYVENEILTTNESYINLGDIFKTKFSTNYSFLSNSGSLEMRRTRLTTNNFGLLYFNKGKTKFNIQTNDDNKLSIKSQDLKTSFLKNDTNWRLDVSSLFIISLHSEFLKKYHLKDGYISFTKTKEDKNVHFSSSINYPYKLMVKDDIEYDKYLIKGKINPNTKEIDFNVNEHIKINIADNVNAHIHNIGINIDALTDMVNSLKSTPKNKDQKNLNVSIKADNSYLYISKNRHVLSQHMYLYYSDEILTAGLTYGDGVAGLKYENSHFDAYGKSFNDKFMENLFALSEFKNGSFEFSMSGNTKKYDGIFTINNTTILDYKVLNNILAFVNTIPSLITFSLPEYSKSGLRIKNAYMKFTSQDDQFHLSDISLNSKELNIVGKGDASFKYNTVDAELNLKTDIGSKASKIPLVGHLVMGKDSISTTLKISGALDNPDIKSLIAKDIAVAPLNILLRTLTLPYYLVDGIDFNSTEETIEELEE